MNRRRRLPLALWAAALWMASAACDDAPQSAAAPDAAPTPAPDAAPADAAPADAAPTDAAPDLGPVFDESVHAAQCEAPAREGLEWQPPACAHTVTHPKAVKDIRSSCGPTLQRPTLVRTSYPTHDPSRDLAVLWMGPPGDHSARLRYGERPDQLDREVVGHTFTMDNFEGRRMHEVHLCGLTPGRTWYYQVGGEGADGTPYWTDVTPITTMPAPGDDSEIVFGIAGDTRSNAFNAAWADALQRIAAEEVDTLLFSGDAVQFGIIQESWDYWFEAGEGVFDRLPVIPTNGNHELLAANYLTAFALPGDEENFHYRMGNTLVISLNDLPMSDRTAVQGSTRDYLERVLREHTDATWKILIHHRAHYSASNHGSFMSLREAWGPLIDEYGIDLVVNGHDHNYERTHPIRAEQVVAEGQGTIYTVVAGIGAPMYSNGNEWWTAKSEKVSSFATFRVDGRRAQYRAWRLDGSLLDEFDLEKPAP